MSTLLGHFVSYPGEMEKTGRNDSRGDERKEERGKGMKVKKRKK